MSEYLQRYNERTRPARRRARNAWEKRLRAEVIQHYGGCCVCCLDRTAEFLRVVSESSQPAKRGQGSIYYRLKREGFPEGYNVYCANCAEAYARLGYCPHRDDFV